MKQPTLRKKYKTAQNQKESNKKIELTENKVLPSTFLANKNGWNNLVTIIAILSVMRHILVNYVEFGLLMKIPLSDISKIDTFWFLVAMILNFIRAMAGFYIRNSLVLSSILVCISEVLVSTLIFYKIKYTYLSGWGHIISATVDMKMVSFAMNRTSQSIMEFLHFMVLPTLVFKNTYKLKKSPNYRYIWKKSVISLANFIIFVFVMDQYAIPSVYRIVHGRSYLTLLENLISLSLSTTILFNLLFQLVFNGFLDIISEIARYDEHIYKKWWNSKSTGEFWTLWNVPVHEYFKFHVYIPLRSRGYSRLTATTVVFIFSGFLHEIVVALSIKRVSGWFFLAMVAQVPLIYISEALKNRFPEFSNTFFWISLCVIGQPVVFLLYMRSLYIINDQDSKSSIISRLFLMGRDK